MYIYIYIYTHIYNIFARFCNECFAKNKNPSPRDLRFAKESWFLMQLLFRPSSRWWHRAGSRAGSQLGSDCKICWEYLRRRGRLLLLLLFSWINICPYCRSLPLSLFLDVIKAYILYSTERMNWSAKATKMQFVTISENSSSPWNFWKMMMMNANEFLMRERRASN